MKDVRTHTHKNHNKKKIILYYSKCIIINHRNYSTLQKYIYINVLKNDCFSLEAGISSFQIS